MRGVSNRRIISYDRRGDECINPVTLFLSNLTYANASERYFLYNGLMTGPFAANVPATRFIGGRRYVQIERSVSTLNTYSDYFDFWPKSEITIATDAISGPLLGSLADKIQETAVDDGHGVHQYLSFVNGNSYTFSCFAKKAERDIFRMMFSGPAFSGTPTLIVNLSTGEIVSQQDVNWVTVQSVGDNDWYLCTINATCISTGSSTAAVLRIGTAGYPGVEGYGMYIWGANIVSSAYISSYIYAGSSPTTRAKDEAYFATVDVSAWMRDGFTIYAYPEFSSAQLAADGGIRYIATLDTTAEVIEIYLDAGGNIVVVGLVSGLFVQASGLTWSAYQRLKISIEYNNGANSVLTTSGFTTGNAATTGIAFSGAGGPVYLGMTKLLAGQWDGLLTLPEPL